MTKTRPAGCQQAEKGVGVAEEDTPDTSEKERTEDVGDVKDVCGKEAEEVQGRPKVAPRSQPPPLPKKPVGIVITRPKGRVVRLAQRKDPEKPQTSGPSDTPPPSLPPSPPPSPPPSQVPEALLSQAPPPLPPPRAQSPLSPSDPSLLSPTPSLLSQPPPITPRPRSPSHRPPAPPPGAVTSPSDSPSPLPRSPSLRTPALTPVDGPPLDPSSTPTSDPNPANSQGEDESYYDECLNYPDSENYEDIDDWPEKDPIDKQSQETLSDEEENFYDTADPEESGEYDVIPASEPDPVPKPKVKEGIERGSKSSSSGWFSNLFRRSTNKKSLEKQKKKKGDSPIKRSRSAPDTRAILREVPLPELEALSDNNNKGVNETSSEFGDSTKGLTDLSDLPGGQGEDHEYVTAPGEVSQPAIHYGGPQGDPVDGSQPLEETSPESTMLSPTHKPPPPLPRLPARNHSLTSPLIEVSTLAVTLTTNQNVTGSPAVNRNGTRDSNVSQTTNQPQSEIPVGSSATDQINAGNPSVSLTYNEPRTGSPAVPMTIPQSAAPLGGNPTITKCPQKESGRVGDVCASLSEEIRVPCPTCNTPFILPPTGVRGLSTNSFANSLQEVVMSQSSDNKKCNNCDTSPAMYRCLDCRYYLCSGCRNAHNWLKITRSHRVMTLGELRSGRYQRELTQNQEILCDIHKEHKVEWMCLYCDKPICSECKLQGHYDHRSGDLGEAAGRDRALITSLVDSVATRKALFNDTKQHLLDYKTQCGKEKEELVVGLGRQRDAIIEALKETFDDLVQEVEGAYELEGERTQSVETEVGSSLNHMTHSCEMASQLLTHGKTEDILLMSKLIKVNLNQFSFAAPPDLDTRPFVQYSPSGLHKTMLVSLFGRLARRRSDIVRARPTMKLIMPDKHPRSDGQEMALLHTFRAKTLTDGLGCKPSGLILSENDDIVLVDDINKKIKVYDALGVVRLELQPEGDQALIDPWDVTITYQGNLAVTDRGARCVKVFDCSGRFVHGFGPHLKSPWGIAANSRGHLIVTDILVKTVFVHDQDGRLLHPIDCKGHPNLFVCPEYVKVNHNDDVIVSDLSKHCITVFDAQGRFLFRYGARGNRIHEFSVPCGVAVDRTGHILVADYSNQRVHRLTRDGQFVQFILQPSHGLLTPQTLAVNSQGHLVVIDGTNVKTFGLTHDPDPDPESDLDPIYEPLQFSNKLYAGAGVRFSRTISESEA